MRIEKYLETTHKRLDLILQAIFAGIIIAVIFTCFFPNSNQNIFSGRLGGDFPAFYGAAKIIHSGEWTNLYDSETQKQSQSELLSVPNSDDYLMFAYPPFVAAIISPLATLSYPQAYLVFSILILLALFLSCKYLQLILPSLPISTKQLFMISCLAYPIFRGTFGGQNTNLSLLCLLGAGYYFKAGKDIRAGLFLGLWFFKIQFALPVFIFFLTTKRFKILLGVLPITIGYYLIGSMIGGWDWPVWWQKTALQFVELDLTANLHNSVTIKAFLLRAIGKDLPSLYLPCYYLLVGILSLPLFLQWRNHSNKNLPTCLAITSCTLVLLSPHALFYDAGLALITSAVLLVDRRIFWLITLIAGTWLDLISDILPIQPTFLILIILLVLIYLPSLPFRNKIASTTLT